MNTQRRRSMRLIVGYAILACVGCTGPTEAVRGAAGAYGLRTVAGVPLPVRLDTVGATTDLLSDTLVLGPDGTAERRTRVLVTFAPSPPGPGASAGELVSTGAWRSLGNNADRVVVDLPPRGEVDTLSYVPPGELTGHLVLRAGSPAQEWRWRR